MLFAAAVVLALASDPAVPPPRDPFASLLNKDVGDGQKPLLERTKLDDMRLQGVVAGTAAPRALVALPDGTTHLIRVGTALGTNAGRVVAIRPGVVVVREEFIDFTGYRNREDVELTTR